MEAEKLVQSFNKLRSNLEEKKTVLEQFQVHLEALFDWQKELDELNVKAQVFFKLQRVWGLHFALCTFQSGTK